MLFRTLSLTLLVFICLGSVVDAQQMEMPKPGEEHNLLMKEVGEWTIKGKMFMPQSAVEFEGEEKVNAVGGFWTVSNYSSTAMGGMQGSATIGYDPVAKKYIGTWVDSIQPSPTNMTGTYDAKTKTMTFDTTGIGMDGKPMPGKIIIQHKGDDSRTFTMMHKDPTGQTDELVKTIEMQYTRKKSENSAE